MALVGIRFQRNTRRAAAVANRDLVRRPTGSSIGYSLRDGSWNDWPDVRIGFATNDLREGVGPRPTPAP